MAAKITGYSAGDVTGDDVKMSELHKIVIAPGTPVREKWWIKINPVEALSPDSTAKNDPAYTPTSYYLTFTHTDGTICKTDADQAARLAVSATDA